MKKYFLFSKKLRGGRKGGRERGVKEEWTEEERTIERETNTLRGKPNRQTEFSIRRTKTE